MGKILFVLMLLALTMIGFTWEGELDPNEFSRWKVVKVSPGPPDGWWIFVRNPDTTSLIDLVALGVNDDSILLTYRYFKQGEPFVYDFEAELDEYVRRYLPSLERYKCIACHIGEEV